MRKTLYKHPAYLGLYCSLVSYLLSGPAPHGISQYTGSFAICQASSSLGSFFEENQRTRKYLESKWLQSVRRHVLFFPKPLHLLNRKRILVIYSQIKALNGPLFFDIASSISVSFREMELIRKGQRASQLQKLWRVFFSVSATVTVVLCSRRRIKRA